MLDPGNTRQEIAMRKTFLIGAVLVLLSMGSPTAQDAKHVLEMRGAADQDPIQTL